MALITDRQSYYFDEETGWLHMKLIELNDRQHKDEENDIETLDLNSGNAPFKIKGFPHMVGTPSKDGPNNGLLNDGVENSFGAIYRWNMGKGQNILAFELENVYTNKETGEVYEAEDVFDPSELEQECDDFTEDIFLACETGFQIDQENPGTCTDIDECLSPDSNQCVEPATCVNIGAGYQCECSEGYTKGDNEFTCRDIDECDNAVNSHKCEDPASCSNTVGSYECSCPTGWELDEDQLRCINIDECQLDNLNNCVSPAECNDNDGSYTCSCPDGYALNHDKFTCDNINECEDRAHDCVYECNDTTGSYTCACPNDIGWTLNEDGRNCSDVDECLTMERTFNVPACLEHHKCINNIGSYVCECGDGYAEQARVVMNCDDIDECTAGTDNCHKNAKCTNIPGEFICECKLGLWGDGVNKCKNINECDLENEHDLFHECDVNAECTDSWGSYKCNCNDGYEGGGRVGKCININECERNTDDCDQHATCSDTVGSFDCQCIDGYEGSGKDGDCININECEGDHTCNENTSDCVDNAGSYICECNDGYEKSDNGVCIDIDECTRQTDDCDANAECINNTGSFLCRCNNGYTGDGKDGQVGCNDIDECEEGTDNCNVVMSTCANIIGSFTCECNDGFQLNDRDECVDIDECNQTDQDDIPLHDCDERTSNCENTHGSFECPCKDGFVQIVGINDKTCHDIDECAHELHNNCDVNANCANFAGGFNCTCNDGFVGNGIECDPNQRDECLLGIHDCDLTSTTCEDTPTGYNCNCKGSRYVQQDNFNCAFNITSCDSKQELGVAWQWGKRCKPQNDGWYYKGQDSVALKCQVNGQHWRKAYTGFNIFAKIHCGTDFIKGIADGRIQYNIVDKFALYQPGSAYYRKGSYNAEIFQVYPALFEPRLKK